MKLAIDQSLSCSGVVITDDSNNIIHAETIQTNIDLRKFYNMYSSLEYINTNAYKSGIIDENGKVQKKMKDLTDTDKQLLKVDPSERINFICRHIKTLIIDYKIDEVVCENISYGSPGQVITLARLLGNIERTAIELECKFTLIEPTKLKKFATGKGNAKKEKMFESVPDVDLKTIYTYVDEDSKIDDVVDAYWLAMYH